jgi:hypothetical protein
LKVLEIASGLALAMTYGFVALAAVLGGEFSSFITSSLIL